MARHSSKITTRGRNARRRWQGTDLEKIAACTSLMIERANEWANPFGDGTAGERILGILKQQLER